MAEKSNILKDGDSLCNRVGSEFVHRYLDGDLSFRDQPDLFVHMADCQSCRRMMESVLAFRRMSRQEFLAYPPAADDVFFERLSSVKKMSDKVHREKDRQPLWNARRSVSLRSALALASVVFLVGLFLPGPDQNGYATALIQMEVERVQFEPSDSVVVESHIYHWIDGVTVEAVRGLEDAPKEAF